MPVFTLPWVHPLQQPLALVVKRDLIRRQILPELYNSRGVVLGWPSLPESYHRSLFWRRVFMNAITGHHPNYARLGPNADANELPFKVAVNNLYIPGTRLLVPRRAIFWA